MKRPYANAALLAVLIHISVLSLVGFVASGVSPLAPVSQPPVQIEIEPPRLVSTHNSIHLASGGPRPTPPKAVAPLAPTPKPVTKPKVKTVVKSRVHHRQRHPKAAPAHLATRNLPAPLPAKSVRNSVGLPASTSAPMSDNRGAAKNASTYGPPEGQGGGTYSSASYRCGALPSYPDSERTFGREGVVTVRVLVGKDGHPVSVVVRNTSGHADFDNAALEAVRKWKFSPARRGGIAVAGFFDVRVRFHLNDAGLMTRRY